MANNSQNSPLLCYSFPKPVLYLLKSLDLLLILSLNICLLFWYILLLFLTWLIETSTWNKETMSLYRCVCVNPPCGNRLLLLLRVQRPPDRCHSSKSSQPVRSWRWWSGASRAACKWTASASVTWGSSRANRMSRLPRRLPGRTPLTLCAGDPKRLNCAAVEQNAAR